MILVARLRALSAQWRETARRVRPLERAPISPVKRDRVTKWMIYTICADELDALIAGLPPSPELESLSLTDDE